MAATQDILACRHGLDILLKLELSNRMGKKSDFE